MLISFQIIFRFLQHFAISSSLGEESVCSGNLSNVFSDEAFENTTPESKKKVNYSWKYITLLYLAPRLLEANIAYE